MRYNIGNDFGQPGRRRAGCRPSDLRRPFKGSADTDELSSRARIYLSNLPNLFSRSLALDGGARC